MQTKTYFASSVPAALEVARRELGDDALLVNSKPAPPAARSFGRLEVTFAWDPQPVPQAKPARETKGAWEIKPLREVKASAATAEKPTVAPSRMLQLADSRPPASELDDIRRQLSALRHQVSRPGPSAREEGDHLVHELVRGGLEEETARNIFTAAAKRPGERRSGLMQELMSRIPEASFPDVKAGESRTVALVGPPGRGKSTTLVKIAMRCGLAKRVPVKIYTAGSHGVCGEEQMARFATILGVPFQACESLESLSLALDGDMWKGLSLIDTPGLSSNDTAEIAAFGRFFARRTDLEKHLVLRSDTRSADMMHAIARFEPIAINRLLFTGVDETTSPGSMIETLMRSRIAASFVGTGQQIPEDLEPMNITGLARAVCGENALAAIAA